MVLGSDAEGKYLASENVRRFRVVANMQLRARLRGDHHHSIRARPLSRATTPCRTKSSRAGGVAGPRHTPRTALGTAAERAPACADARSTGGRR